MWEMIIWGCEYFLSLIFSSAAAGLSRLSISVYVTVTQDMTCHFFLDNILIHMHIPHLSNAVILCVQFSICDRSLSIPPLCRAPREALRWTIFSMQATGHILLGSSCYIEQLLEEEERAEKSLALPQESRIRQLQSMLLGKISHWWWTRADEKHIVLDLGHSVDVADETGDLHLFMSSFADISVSSHSHFLVLLHLFLSHVYVEAVTTCYSSESTFTHNCLTFSYGDE